MKKLLRAELRGMLRAKLLRGGAVRAACQFTPGRDGLRAMMWQHLRCGLTAGHVTGGRAAGQEMTNMRGDAGCGLNCNLRGGLQAQISSPRRALLRVRKVLRYSTVPGCHIGENQLALDSVTTSTTMKGTMTYHASVRMCLPSWGTDSA